MRLFWNGRSALGCLLLVLHSGCVSYAPDRGETSPATAETVSVLPAERKCVGITMVSVPEGEFGNKRYWLRRIADSLTATGRFEAFAQSEGRASRKRLEEVGLLRTDQSDEGGTPDWLLECSITAASYDIQHVEGLTIPPFLHNEYRVTAQVVIRFTCRDPRTSRQIVAGEVVGPGVGTTTMLDFNLGFYGKQNVDPAEACAEASNNALAQLTEKLVAAAPSED